MVVGVSKFQKLDASQQLEFADKDAEAFAKFIQSPRGRGFPADHVKLLTNENVTYAQLRSTLGTWLKRNSKAEDMIYIFLATHGMVDKEEPRRTYLLTTEADPEDLYDTTMSMNEITDIIGSRLKSAGRIVLFADACRSGKMGTGIGGDIQKGASGNQEIVGLLASRARELSEEGKQYCNGHGAFTCYLLKGLNGEADGDKDGTVTAGELIRYLRDSVAKATKDKQTPQEFGEFEASLPMSFADKPGVDLGFTELMFPTPWRKLPTLWASLSLPNIPWPRLWQDQPLPTPTMQGKWEQYQRLLVSGATDGEKADAHDELAVALEEEGQKVLQTYLRGDASPLTVPEYRAGEIYFSRAAELNPTETRLKAKARFCAGRALLMENQLRDAETALRESIGIDPGGAYSHNALGICYTALRRSQEAEREFRTAFDNAPRWAYPHYNLAIVYVQLERYRDAEAEYKAAIALGPNYAYLYRQLGDLYQNQLHRQDDAEKMYRKALELSPNDPDTHSNLGALYVSRGDLRLAETSFRKAIEEHPKTNHARVNLGLLLIDRNRKDEAEEVLRAAVAQSPEDPRAHLVLGNLLLERNKLDDAETEFTMLVAMSPNDGGALELLGDVHVKQKRYAEAVQEYTQASKLIQDPVALARIGRKQKSAEKSK